MDKKGISMIFSAIIIISLLVFFAVLVMVFFGNAFSKSTDTTDNLQDAAGGGDDFSSIECQRLYLEAKATGNEMTFCDAEVGEDGANCPDVYIVDDMC